MTLLQHRRPGPAATPAPAPPRRRERWRRSRPRSEAVLSLVVDGVVDEAAEYVDAVVVTTARNGDALEAWWRAHGWGRLELRCEVWGADRDVHVSATEAGVRCVVQRAPDTAWSGQDPFALARADLDEVLTTLASELDLPAPPVLHG